MSHHTSSENPTNATAVAVDRDKHSSGAVKWAIDNLLSRNPTVILVHVRIKIHQNQIFSANGAAIDANNGSGNPDVNQIFKPSRVYCARKGITVKEVVLEDTDVSKALLDFISKNHIANIVLGSPARNAIARKFWTPDVPTIINKAAPDFCTVYVVSKGHTLSVRPAATRSACSSTTQPRPKSPRTRSPTKLHHIETDDNSRAKFMRAEKKAIPSEKMWSMKGPVGISMESIDISFIASRKPSNQNSLSSDNDFSAPFHFGSIDATPPNLDYKSLLEAVDNGSSGPSSKELEDEMKRLKLELKQTLDMYNIACREAVSAKQKAQELSQWKLEEARKCEQARLTGEAALAVFEMEKAKSRAAIEAAKKAQQLVDVEAQRRKFAEEKANQEDVKKDRALNVMSHHDVRYRKYSIEEIEQATNKFSNSFKIGEGGYGPVFKGKLDHTPVAIKVLRHDAAQGRKQFHQEIEVLSSIRHPHMVLLLGACPEYGCLVYEFMSNGSLEDRLFRKGNTPPIPWRTRFKLAADIATGLLFLHQTKPEPLVHRDLKPANILLDHNYVCKISDVGLARLVPPSVANSVTQYHMTSAAGTFCYIDPEYQQTGKLGTKSDIYSLGVMLLQIITARPPMGLTHHVEKVIERGTFADLLDPTVPDWPVEEAICFAKLALQCVELRKRDRPDLGSVIVPELNRLKELGMYSISTGYP